MSEKQIDSIWLETYRGKVYPSKVVNKYGEFYQSVALPEEKRKRKNKSRKQEKRTKNA